MPWKTSMKSTPFAAAGRMALLYNGHAAAGAAVSLCLFPWHRCLRQCLQHQRQVRGGLDQLR
ncbi:MAG TPA: hypothetical protein PKY40_10215, partial [Burkholderiaceae bacterium]|nr:hypothetical protein [Burkholderiaceae bacterium]